MRDYHLFLVFLPTVYFLRLPRSICASKVLQEACHAISLIVTIVLAQLHIMRDFLFHDCWNGLGVDSTHKDRHRPPTIPTISLAAT